MAIEQPEDQSEWQTKVVSVIPEMERQSVNAPFLGLLKLFCLPLTTPRHYCQWPHIHGKENPFILNSLQ